MSAPRALLQMGERMIAHALVTAVVMIMVLSFQGTGWSQAVNDKPVFQPGDSWEFLRTDAKDGKSSNWVRTVVAIESPERIAVKWETGAIEYIGTSQVHAGVLGSGLSRSPPVRTRKQSDVEVDSWFPSRNGLALMVWREAPR